MSEIEWVTIAEAARRLGLAERQARRWADRLPADARRQEETTPGRSRALVQLAALKHLFEADSDRTSDRTVSGQVTGQLAEPAPVVVLAARPAERTEEPENFPVPLALAMTAQRDALERVMLEKERVISEQAARICDLQAALEHERGQARQLAESLAREQTLRMFSPLQSAEGLERPHESEAGSRKTQPTESPVQEGLKMPVEAPDSPQGADRNGGGGLETPQQPIVARMRAYWKRVWY